MGRKKTPGLIKREGTWHIDKQVRGRRIRESCGTGSLREAEAYLAHRLEEIRQAEIFGVRPTRVFRTAATKFVQENEHKRSLRCDIGNLRNLMPWIGELELNRVNMGTLQPWMTHRRNEGVSAGTINHGLKIVRRVLNLASSEWMDEYGLTWISVAPKISLLADQNKRQPYSAPELGHLIEAANKVCERAGERPDLVVLRKIGGSKSPQNPHNGDFKFSEKSRKSLKDMAPPAGLEPATR